MLHFQQLVLPFSRHRCRFQIIRKDLDQGLSVICSHDLFPFPAGVLGMDQFFNDRCPGSRSPESFLLCLCVKFFISCRLHCCKQRILRIRFRRRSEMFRHLRFHMIEGLPFFHLWNRPLCSLFRILYSNSVRISETSFVNLPALFHNLFPFRMEMLTFAFNFHRNLTENMLPANSLHRVYGNQKQNLLLRFLQVIQMSIRKLYSGDDCMVIGHFFIVHDPAKIRFFRFIKRPHQLIFLMDHTDHLSGSCLHIFRQEITVCPWIGDQFFFIKALGSCKSLLRRKTINAVCLSLQGS